MADNEKQLKFTSGMMHTSSIAKAFGAISGQLPPDLKKTVISAEKDMSFKMEEGVMNFDGGDEVSDSSPGEASAGEKEPNKHPEYSGFKTDTQKINRKRNGSDREIQKPVSTFVVKGGAKASVRPPEGPGLTEAEIRESRESVLTPLVLETERYHVGEDDKPKRTTKGQKNFAKRLGALGSSNQKLADAGENHEDGVQEFNNLDTDAVYKYGVIKGKRRTTLRERTAKPIAISYNPATEKNLEGRMDFDGGKKIEPKKEPDRISEPIPIDYGEEFIEDQKKELEVIFKSKGEEALAKELMRRGFAQEREKNGKLFPGVKTGAEEIFEACEKMVKGENINERIESKKEGADHGEDEKELMASFIGEISSADSVKQVLTLVERAGQRLGRHNSGIMKAAKKKIALLGGKANNIGRKNNKGENMGTEGVASVPAEAAKFEDHAKGQGQPNNENTKPYTPISEYSPEDIKAMAERENMTEEDIKKGIIRQNQQAAQFGVHGAEAKVTESGPTFDLTDKQLDGLMNAAQKEAEADGKNVNLGDAKTPSSEAEKGGEEDVFNIEKSSVKELAEELNKLKNKIDSLDRDTEEGRERYTELRILINVFTSEIDSRGKEPDKSAPKVTGPNEENEIPVFDPEGLMTPEEKAQARAEQPEREKKEGGEKNVKDLNKELMKLIDEDNELDMETDEGKKRHQELRIQIKALMKEIDDLENGEVDPKPKSPEAEENEEDPNAEKEKSIEISQEVINARAAYLKGLAGARRWFRRTSPEEIRVLEENYNKAFVKFSAIEQADRLRAEFPELEGSELEAKINEVSVELLAQEQMERSEAELELASDGPLKKAGNWLKRHPKTRFGLGIAIGGAGFALGGPLGGLGARALWAGANAAVTTEGALDAAGGELARRWGRLKSVSADEVRNLSTFGINEKLGDQIAFSLRRGQSVENNETVQNLIAETARDLQAAIEKGMAEGKSPDAVRADLLEKSLGESNEAIEKAQQEERKRSIKRWVAGATVGAVVGGTIAYLGMENISGSESNIPEAGSGDVMQGTVEAAPTPSPDELINNFSATEVAGPGDGEWDLIARPMRELADKMGMSLSDNEVASAVGFVKDRVVSQDMPGRMPGYLGEVKKYIFEGTTRTYSGPELMEAIKHGVANPAEGALPSRSW